MLKRFTLHPVVRSFVFFLMLFCLQASASSLSSSWYVFRQDGNHTHSLPADAQWEEIPSLETFSYENDTPHAQTFWLKTEFEIEENAFPSGPGQDQSLVYDLYPGADAVFWDGNLIGQTGDPTSVTPYTVRVKKRVYFLSPAFLTPGKHVLQIAILKPNDSQKKLFRTSPSIENYSLALGEKGKVYFRILDMPLIAAIILVWLGAYFCLFYRFHRQFKQYFFLAIIDWLISAYIFLDSWKLQEFGLDSLRLLQVTLTTGMWTIYFMQRFFAELLKYPPGKLDRITLFTTIFLSVCMQVVQEYDHVEFVAIMWFPTIFIYLGYFGVKLWKSTGIPRKFDDILAHLTYLSVIVSIFYDAYRFVTIGNVAAISPFCFLFFSIGMGYRLARDFGAALSDRNIQYDVLRKTKELENAYQLDSLTKVGSRRYFEKSILEEGRQITSTKESICMAVLDVDYFKKYNDKYGHPKGDRLLISLGWILNAWKGRDDMVFRIGGEEFLVVMKGRTIETCLRQCERLRKNVEEFPFDHLNENGKHVTISVGVAAFTSELRSLEDLYKVADTRLYEAKKTRNTVYPPVATPDSQQTARA